MAKLPHKLSKQMSFTAPVWPRQLTDCKSYLWMQSEQSLPCPTPIHKRYAPSGPGCVSWFSCTRVEVQSDGGLRMATIREKVTKKVANVAFYEQTKYFSLTRILLKLSAVVLIFRDSERDYLLSSVPQVKCISNSFSPYALSGIIQ